MSSEMVRRLKVAGDYQRKAIKALFPEEMSGHLDVIEREIKAMLVELGMEIGKEHKETTEENKKTKKVDIE